MAVRQEAPLRRGPILRTPEKRVGGARKALVVTTAATGFAITGLLVYEAIQPKQQNPDQTPIPGGIVEPSNSPIPTPFSTENPIVTLPPTPGITPSPTPTPTPEITPKPTPKETPVPNIENVKLVSEGRLILLDRNEHDYYPEDKPDLVIYAQNATVVAIERDKENDLLWIGVSIPGDFIQGKVLELDKNDPLSYTINVFTGATLWFNISGETPIVDDTFWGFPVGNGSEALLPYIRVGETIPNIMAETLYNKDYDPSRTPEEVTQNANTLDNLKSSIGKNFLRSDKRFSFSAAVVVVSAPDLNLNLQ